MGMRFLALPLLLVLAGCGSSPVAPAPVPTPVPFPVMIGGWGGTFTETHITSLGPGGGSCAETWIITGQTNGDFIGTYQRSGEGCPVSGAVSGKVLVDGSVQLSHVPTSVVPFCTILGGNTAYTGVVSSAGGLTARAAFSERCPYGRGTLDYVITATMAMNRR